MCIRDSLLTNLDAGDVLFIDEIHRLNTVIEEYLYSAMEDYRIDIMTVSYTHLRAHETVLDLVCRLLLEKKKIINTLFLITFL